MCWFWGWGTLLGLSVFFNDFKDEFNLSTSDTELIQSISTSCVQFVAFLSGVLVYFSPQGRPFWFLLLGALLVIGGFLVASFATNVLVLWFAAAIGFGVGTSFLTVSSQVVLPSYLSLSFQNSKQTYLGICAAGSGVGALVLAYLFTWLNSLFGWRDALRCSAALAALTLIPSLFIYLKVPIKPLIRRVFRISVLMNKWVALLAFCSVGFYFTYFSLNFYLVPYSTDEMNMSDYEISTAIALIGVLSTIGRVAMGYLSDYSHEPVIIWCIGMSVKALATILMVSTTYTSLYWISIITGGIAHAAGIFLIQIITDEYDSQDIPTIYGGIYCISGLGSLFGPFVLGYLVNTLGYFYGMLVMQSMLIPVLLVLCYYRSKKSQRAADKGYVQLQ
jgi:predicted MFS family arabinose efflux permease